MNFMDELRNTALNSENNMSVTENGAVGYKSTFNPILDANFSIASMRSRSDEEIIDTFRKAYAFDAKTAIMWLFFVRDVRGGLGERRYFRVCMNWLANVNINVILTVLAFIAEYGRWDDVVYIYANTTNAKVHNAITKMIKKQIYNDTANALAGKSISLLAKWLPSANATCKKNAEVGQSLAKALYKNHKPKTAFVLYRKKLVELRKHIQIVEQKMSANRWSEINYEAVPSKANLLYMNAFMRHDTDRRADYLDRLSNGEVKINSGVAYPYEIVHRYKTYGVIDETLEGMWKALPDTVQGNSSTLVVADGSGSMTIRVGDTSVTALDVANSLAIYFAEHCKGEFKDKYITFSETPQFVDMSYANTLRGKLDIANTHCEVSNTNIKAVFDMILETAVRCRMTHSDMPNNILIISDMEFDYCATTEAKGRYFAPVTSPTPYLFDRIRKQYEDAGYKMPRLVFWNVNGRTDTIPVVQNDLGVALVSGFSVNTIKMVMSGELDPYKCLLEQVYSDRYEAIGNAIANLKC